MSEIWKQAITRDNFPVLILKGNTVVGKARWSAAADGLTSMRIIEGEALAWVEKMAAEHGQGVMQAKHFTPRYYDFTGEYAQRLDPGWEFMDEAFGETRAVSEFALNYGMVPAAFKDVEGYRSKFSQPERAEG